MINMPMLTVTSQCYTLINHLVSDKPVYGSEVMLPVYMKRHSRWPVLPDQQCPCPKKGRQDICEEESGRDPIQYCIFPRKRTKDSS